jgi:hypothetical protein
MYFNHLTGPFVLDHAHAFYDVRISQTHLTTWTEAIVFLGWILQKIVLFDVKDS